MPAKRVDSLRQKQVPGTFGDKVVRLLLTQPFIDDRWLKGVNRANLKTYLVVRYPANAEKYLAVWNEYKGKRVQWWDSAIHEEIKSKITGYDTNTWSRKKKDRAKADKARILFTNYSFEHYHFDSFAEAQNKYISLCKNSVEPLKVSSNSGDD